MWRAAASLTKAGAGKSGNPCPRFTAPCCTASAVISEKIEVPIPFRRSANWVRAMALDDGLDLERSLDHPEPEADPQEQHGQQGRPAHRPQVLRAQHAEQHGP